MSSREKDKGNLFAQEKGCFPELWAFKLPNSAHFGGYNWEISQSLPVCFCCWVIEETTKPAEGTLILSSQDHRIF